MYLLSALRFSFINYLCCDHLSNLGCSQIGINLSEQRIRCVYLSNLGFSRVLFASGYGLTTAQFQFKDNVFGEKIGEDIYFFEY